MSTFQRAARPEGAPEARRERPAGDRPNQRPATASAGPKPRNRPRTVDRTPPVSAPAADPGERLSKRVMQLKGCSRSEAEQYIECGWVMVNGVVVEDPPFRVQQQTVTMDPAASLLNMADVTLILNKPSGWLDGVEEEDDDEDDAPRPASGPRGRGGKGAKPRVDNARSLLTAANHCPHDPAEIRLLKRHLLHLEAEVPLETGASGLVVFTQDWRTTRKLSEDLGSMEHEIIADVAGEVDEEALQKIARALKDERTPLPHTKFSVNSSSEEMSKLRFAIKGAHPGLVAYLCERGGLQLLAMRRIRLGRVTLSDLPVGQWRYLSVHEKF
ncbi:RNA-binding protein [Rhodoferax lacus]|uniref:Dual-specificity RNA pseudouridine synthase RluF n=1 Tax=Rhodoferax lacus TaxID=2184758 RepID=A0A3E1RA47_9BURK|nr:RNA pseudouridine synthase [Rhodoferax lacus]RFO95902.1 RNA-binding protein [Rhodoferax lacus]